MIYELNTLKMKNNNGVLHTHIKKYTRRFVFINNKNKFVYCLQKIFFGKSGIEPRNSGLQSCGFGLAWQTWFVLFFLHLLVSVDHDRGRPKCLPLSSVLCKYLPKYHFIFWHFSKMNESEEQSSGDKRAHSLFKVGVNLPTLLISANHLDTFVKTFK